MLLSKASAKKCTNKIRINQRQNAIDAKQFAKIYNPSTKSAKIANYLKQL
jgi:hypothetical protein